MFKLYAFCFLLFNLITFNNFNLLNKHKTDLILTSKVNLNSFVKRLPISNDNKKVILNELFILSNPIYYLYYPSLFKDFFTEIDTKSLEKIAVSSFLYYKSIILTDEIFDNPEAKNTFKIYLNSNICQEESIKLLSDFFNSNDNFWKSWNIRKAEYVQAYKIDKTAKTLSKEDFEQLADYKSAFGKIGIDILHHLTRNNNQEIYNDLIESHKLFYCAFQIIDDISDLKEDYKNQYNSCFQKLEATLKKENDTTDNYSIEDIEKLSYIKGGSEKLYLQAIQYLKDAEVIVLKYDVKQVSQWLFEIRLLYNQTIRNYLNINGFVASFETDLSNTLLKNDIKTAIQKSKTFLQNGSFKDLFTQNGISNVFTEYFVKNELYITSTTSGLTGASEFIIPDALTSCLAFLTSKNLTKNNIQELLEFQNKDGGFSKYKDENEVFSLLNSTDIDVSGWIRSHFCVSALVYKLLSKQTIKNKKLTEYLISELSSDKKNLSYWFSNDNFALFLILSSSFIGKKLKNICIQRIENNLQITDNLFDNAFLLKSLLISDELFERHKRRIETIKEKIIANQHTDGSFSESYFYKIPHPSVVDVNIVDGFTKNKNGYNIIVNDFGRIFTSSTCVSALSLYEKRCSK